MEISTKPKIKKSFSYACSFITKTPGLEKLRALHTRSSDEVYVGQSTEIALQHQNPTLIGIVEETPAHSRIETVKESKPNGRPIIRRKTTTENTTTFVYGNQPFGCEKHQGCPMRFNDKAMQQLHYNNFIRSSSKHFCYSCLRSDRVVSFTTKRELVDHMVNPNIFPRLPVQDKRAGAKEYSDDM